MAISDVVDVAYQCCESEMYDDRDCYVSMDGPWEMLAPARSGNCV